MSGIVNFFKSLTANKKSDGAMIGLTSLNVSRNDEVFEAPKKTFRKEPTLTELLRKNPY